MSNVTAVIQRYIKWKIALVLFSLCAGVMQTVGVALAQGVPFDTPSTIPLGTIPRSLALGDFNGDGTLDVAIITGREVRSISLLSGSGTGSFQPASTLSIAQSPLSVAFGDFDVDGRLDLLVISGVPAELSPSNSLGVNTAISTLRGNGSGSFGLPTVVELPGGPCASAIGDFNQDGKPDLAVVRLTRPVTDGSFFLQISILLGDGFGSFEATNNIVLAEISTPVCADVVIADFNGDARLDLAVGSDPGFLADILVVLGDGAGGFGAVLRSPGGGGGLGGFAAADFDQDGNVDLVARGPASQSVRYFRGDGTGTFAAPIVIVEHASSAVGAMVVGDVNQDGKKDLVVAGNGECCLSVYLGRGNGTFENPKDFAFGLNGTDQTSVAIGDLNGDGKPDLVAANAFNELLATYLNTPVNQPPKVTAFFFTPSVVDPFVGPVVTQLFPQTFFFTVEASDADGVVEHVRWDFNGDGVTDQTTTTLSTSFTYVSPGSFGAADIFRVTATVVDNAGATGAAVTTATLLTPSQFISHITQLLTGFLASGDIKNSGTLANLSANLTSASSALTRDQRIAASKSLRTELNKLNSFVDHGQIKPVVRDTLVPLINSLLSSLE